MRSPRPRWSGCLALGLAAACASARETRAEDVPMVQLGVLYAPPLVEWRRSFEVTVARRTETGEVPLAPESASGKSTGPRPVSGGSAG